MEQYKRLVAHERTTSRLQSHTSTVRSAVGAADRKGCVGRGRRRRDRGGGWAVQRSLGCSQAGPPHSAPTVENGLPLFGNEPKTAIMAWLLRHDNPTPHRTASAPVSTRGQRQQGAAMSKRRGAGRGSSASTAELCPPCAIHPRVHAMRGAGASDAQEQDHAEHDTYSQMSHVPAPSRSEAGARAHPRPRRLRAPMPPRAAGAQRLSALDMGEQRQCSLGRLPPWQPVGACRAAADCAARCPKSARA